MEPHAAGVSNAFHTALSDARRLASLAKSGDMSVNDVVGMYYAVSGVVTVVHMRKDGAARKDGGALDSVSDDDVSEAEEFVYGTFNTEVHPRIKGMISGLIEDAKSELLQKKSADDGDCCGRDGAGDGNGGDGNNGVGLDAALDTALEAKYEDLRRLMSVGEFVRQYDAMMMGAEPDADR